MQASRIEDLLRLLGCRRVKTTGTRVRSSCPLGPWRHSGRDEHPSFVVFAADEDESRCNCLGASCGFKGTLMQLIWAIEKHSGSKLPTLMSIVQKHDQADIAARLARAEDSLGIFSTTKKDRMPGAITGGVDVGDVISQVDSTPDLEQFSHMVEEMQELLDDEALTYLHGPDRRISDEAIKRWKLGWHPGARRIAVPQYDRRQRLVNLSGRLLEHPDNWLSLFYRTIPWMHAGNFRKELFLFGEDKFTSYDGDKTMVLVEGMFDAIFLDSKGVPNVAAMLGASLSKTQIAKILRWFNKLVIVPDGDQPGWDAANKINDIISQKMPVIIYPIRDGIDPDGMTDEEVEDLKANYI